MLQRDGELARNQFRNSEIKCIECHLREPGEGGICNACKAAKPFRFTRKYTVTPEILEEIRLAYTGGRNEVAAKLRKLSERTGIPTQTLKDTANGHGWYCCSRRRRWSPQDDMYLRERLGVFSITSIARRLNRSRASVEWRARQFDLSVRITEGYTVFGVNDGTVRRWIDRGLFGKAHQHGRAVRLTEANVVRFIRTYPHEYNLRRVDQVWLKGMLFGGGR